MCPSKFDDGTFWVFGIRSRRERFSTGIAICGKYRARRECFARAALHSANVPRCTRTGASTRTDLSAMIHGMVRTERFNYTDIEIINSGPFVKDAPDGRPPDENRAITLLYTPAPRSPNCLAIINTPVDFVSMQRNQ